MHKGVAAVRAGQEEEAVTTTWLSVIGLWIVLGFALITQWLIMQRASFHFIRGSITAILPPGMRGLERAGSENDLRLR